MTAQETKDYISGRLTVPLTEVSRIIESFNATIDLVTALNTDVIPTWTPLLTFQTDGTDDGKYCKHPDSEGKVRIWETKIDDNTANEPPVDPGTSEDANWKEISPSAAAAIPEWAPGLYGAGLVIVFHNHSADGPGLYVLLEPVRPFTSTNIESEITGGKWEKISGSSGVPSSLQQTITKSSHGFSLKDVITLNSSGVHVKVTDPASNKFVGLVTEVVDANSFRIHTAGYVTGLTGLTAGAIHYAQTDGTLGTTVTDMPVLFADSTTSGYILASGATASAGLRLGTAAGTDTYTLTLSPALTEYTAGLTVLVNFANANTGASTLNVDSLGAKSIVVRPSVPVIAGQLTGYKLLFYDGTQFQVVDIPYVTNSTSAKGLYVDTTGRVRALPGSVYTELSRSWVHTGTDDSDTELVKFQNDSLELVFKLLNSKTAEFGHSGSFILEVVDAITSGNAFFFVNNNQELALQFMDKLLNKIMTLRSTTGDQAVVVHGFEKDFGNFRNIVRQVHASTSDTAATQNVIATIAVPTGHSIQVRVKSCHAWSESGERMISCNPFVAIGFNSGSLEGTSATPEDIYHGGPSSGGFNVNFNSSTDEVEIRLLNETGTGHTYITDVEFEYMLIPIPA